MCFRSFLRVVLAAIALQSSLASAVQQGNCVNSNVSFATQSVKLNGRLNTSINFEWPIFFDHFNFSDNSLVELDWKFDAEQVKLRYGFSLHGIAVVKTDLLAPLPANLPVPFLGKWTKTVILDVPNNITAFRWSFFVDGISHIFPWPCAAEVYTGLPSDAAEQFKNEIKAAQASATCEGNDGKYDHWQFPDLAKLGFDEGPVTIMQSTDNLTHGFVWLAGGDDNRDPTLDGYITLVANATDVKAAGPTAADLNVHDLVWDCYTDPSLRNSGMARPFAKLINGAKQSGHHVIV